MRTISLNIAFLLIFWTTYSNANQIQEQPGAIQFVASLSQEILSSIPLVNLDAPNAMERGPSAMPSLEFAKTRTVDISTDSHGNWSTVGEVAIWRLRLQSLDAASVNLGFSRFVVPEGSRLFLFDSSGQIVAGPYGHNESNALWTPMVMGDTAVVELRVPMSARDAVEIGLTTVGLGYPRSMTKGRSGSCQVASSCPAGDAWTEAERATAMITVGGRFQCSAVLLNNTADDGRPLLLTAKHCGIGSSPELSARSVVVYWNYNQINCDDDSRTSPRYTQSGATLLAEATRTDFALIELDERPPLEANAFYSGWSISETPPASGAGLHHPRGDAKKISLFNRPAEERTVRIENFILEGWQVEWDLGAVEKGSSGSGLWNSDQRLVGQLSGGNISCDAARRMDFYGRFSESWDYGDSDREKLRPWLDPVGANVEAIDGRGLLPGSLFAVQDVISVLRPLAGLVTIDVLRNDIGQQPLQITEVATDNGSVWSNGDVLHFRYGGDMAPTTITYTVMDRFGQTQVGTATLTFSPETQESDDIEARSSASPVRGGALSKGMLMVLAIFCLLTGYRMRNRAT